jgi:hypothetical protein
VQKGVPHSLQSSSTLSPRPASPQHVVDAETELLPLGSTHSDLSAGGTSCSNF